MSKFIELHDEKYDMARLVNLDWVEEIHKDDDGMACVYFAYDFPDSYEQDNFKTVETYEYVKRLIEEATK